MTDNMSSPENQISMQSDHVDIPAPDESDTTPSVSSFIEHSRFVHLRGLISSVDRREKIEERKLRIEDEFKADVDRIAVLSRIESGIDSAAVGDHGRSHTFPSAENLLVGYQNSSEKEKRGLKQGINHFTERAINTIAIRLAGDVRTLRLDQGNTREDADREIDRIINPVISNKKRDFGRIGKSAQMEAIQDLLELRTRLLRENAPTYVYFLSSISEMAGLSQTQIDGVREKLTVSSDEEKVIIAAEVRQKAIKAIDKVAEVNLERLGTIETMQHGVVMLADVLADDYSFATLPMKGKILEKIIDTKLEATLPHIHEIHRLRRLLEHDHSLEETDLDPERNLEQKELLSNEINLIENLIREKIIHHAANSPLGELDITDMEEAVAQLAEKYNDNSLIDIFQKVLLLRTGVVEVLNP